MQGQSRASRIHSGGPATWPRDAEGGAEKKEEQEEQEREEGEDEEKQEEKGEKQEQGQMMAPVL